MSVVELLAIFGAVHVAFYAVAGLLLLACKVIERSTRRARLVRAFFQWQYDRAIARRAAREFIG